MPIFHKVFFEYFSNLNMLCVKVMSTCRQCCLSKYRILSAWQACMSLTMFIITSVLISVAKTAKVTQKCMQVISSWLLFHFSDLSIFPFVGHIYYVLWLNLCFSYNDLEVYVFFVHFEKVPVLQGHIYDCTK